MVKLSHGSKLLTFTGVSWQEIKWVDVGKVVAAVNFNSLQESHRHPQPDQSKMVAKKHNANHEPKPQNCKNNNTR